MFSTPRYVIKDGALIVEEGQLRRAPAGRRLRVAPGYDDAVLPDVRRHFDALFLGVVRELSRAGAAGRAGGAGMRTR